jgi:hypothetical protein
MRFIGQVYKYRAGVAASMNPLPSHIRMAASHRLRAVGWFVSVVLASNNRSA